MGIGIVEYVRQSPDALVSLHHEFVVNRQIHDVQPPGSTLTGQPGSPPWPPANPASMSYPPTAKPGGEDSSTSVCRCRSLCGYSTPAPAVAFAEPNTPDRSGAPAWMLYGAGPWPCGVTLAYPAGLDGVSRGVTGSFAPAWSSGCMGFVITGLRNHGAGRRTRRRPTRRRPWSPAGSSGHRCGRPARRGRPAAPPATHAPPTLTPPPFLRRC